MNRTLIWIALGVVAVIAIIFIINSAATDTGTGTVVTSPSPLSPEAKVSQQALPQSETPSRAGQSRTTGALKEFTLTASNYKFSQTEIRVSRGDRVRITLRNDQGMHDVKIDEFLTGTRVLKQGESQTIEFLADKAGTFEYYCSVDNHRAMGMRGNLIVR